MGAGARKQTALLVFIKQFKFWIFAFLAVVVLLEISLSYVNHLQQQSTWKSVASLLRNEVNSSNSYQISRALSDMEQEGWIKCVKLSETSNDTRIFYDTTSQSYCGVFASKTHGELKAINGATWDMSFASPENLWLHGMRLLLPLLTLLIQVLLFNYLNKQRKQQEAIRLRVQLEKDFLLDVTKQTKHDIASPIGALRIVVKRLDIPAEYSEMLQQIVERIDGIFGQLKNASEQEEKSEVDNESLELVPLDKLLIQIVKEKLSEWSLLPNVISLDVAPNYIVANGTALGRVISNILNNSIEAKKDSEPLRIRVESQVDEKFCTLKFVDNGKGIESDVLTRIGEKGFSYGKPSRGHNMGIGVYNSIKTIQSFGGRFTIASEAGVGTTVSMTLKISK